MASFLEQTGPLEASSAQTAAERKRESVPARIAAHRPKPRRVLDFGCGLSLDVNYFRNLGWAADGYDPFYQPQDLKVWKQSFDLILCSYVLNTLPPAPRALVLGQITELLEPGGRFLLSVRDREQVETERRPDWYPEKDGWRTHRQTFQKGFERTEILQLLEDLGFERPVFLREHHGITVEAVLSPSRVSL